MKPQRIQRKRTKGWKLPPNTVSVTRPGKWGNPFKVVGNVIFGYDSKKPKFADPWVYIDPEDNPNINWNQPSNRIVIDLYQQWIEGKDPNNLTPSPTDFSELKGKNLSCWCKPDQPCHVEVLLKIANK